MYKVLKIGDPKQVTTKNGTKTVVNLFLAKEDNTTMGCDVWGYDSSRGIRIGSQIDISELKTREYKGKIYYSCSNKNISFVNVEDKKIEPTPTNGNTAKSVDHELIKIKTMCLAYAKDIKVVMPAMPIGDIFPIAEDMVAWIYGEKEESKEPEHTIEELADQPLDQKKDNDILFE